MRGVKLIPVNVINGDGYFIESIPYNPFYPYILLLLIVTLIFLFILRFNNEKRDNINIY